MKKWTAIIPTLILALGMVGCTKAPVHFPSTDETDTISFHGQVFPRSALSADTVTWLEWYNCLSEADQLAVSYIPSELSSLSGNAADLPAETQ